ncbi:MAG TPA: type II toxin-antitoxin system HipA family toxin [Clostridiales bacterium]|nr:type II toxin-antitoxin system HipA family toxin [Clostridiales bacterium]
MNCLCCGKPFKVSASPEEVKNGWHYTCIRHFFGTKELPELNLSADTMESLASECTRRGFTVPGVQKKLSLHLSDEKNDKVRLTLVGYPAGYILKPQTADYPALPEAEYLVMQMAKATGIGTVPFSLIKVGEGAELAYITKRIDRTAEGEKIAMEDFCQLDLRITADKYKSSYERCGKIVREYTENPGLDMSEFFLRVVFSFAVGNSDMHLKNFSLIETAPASGIYRLSEAYDMLPVNIILPADKDQMALTLNGKNRNLRRGDFLALAENCGLNPKSARKMLDKIVSMKDIYCAHCRASLLSEERKKALCALIDTRCHALEG